MAVVNQKLQFLDAITSVLTKRVISAGKMHGSPRFRPFNIDCLRVFQFGMRYRFESILFVLSHCELINVLFS